jgi:5-methylcytosine-specific restriction enzyme A
MPGGWVDRKKIPRGPNGRGLCRWCSVEVPARRFTFCSEYCVHEWKLRSQPAYLREQILKRDRGICAHCSIDTIREQLRLKRARGERRVALMLHWGLKRRMRKSLWDADHILPVKEGGGECDLENIRTLCLRCHRKVTAQLRERIRRAKVVAMLAAEGESRGIEVRTTEPGSPPSARPGPGNFPQSI